MAQPPAPGTHRFGQVFNEDRMRARPAPSPGRLEGPPGGARWIERKAEHLSRFFRGKPAVRRLGRPLEGRLVMKSAVLTAGLALIVAAPLAAQRPAPRDTSRRAATGRAMPAQGMHQGMAGMQAGREGMMRCSMMQGGMGHDSAMGEAMEGMMAGM